MPQFTNTISPRLAEVARDILVNEYGWSKGTTTPEVQEWLSQYKQAFEHAFASGDGPERACVQAGLEAVFKAEDDAAIRAEIGMLESADSFILYKDGDGFSVTDADNYAARITDANKVSHYRCADGFETPDDVLDYLDKWGHSLDRSRITVKEGLNEAEDDINPIELRQEEVSNRIGHLEGIVDSLQPSDKEADAAKIALLDFMTGSLDALISGVEERMGLKSSK